MRIFIDADACPVTSEAVILARKFGHECILVSDESRTVTRKGALSITVPVGDDSADDKIANMVESGDIVITGDIGLAANCEAKGAVVLNYSAEVYCPGIIYFNGGSIGRKLAPLYQRKLIFQDRFSQILQEKLEEAQRIEQENIKREAEELEELRRAREQQAFEDMRGQEERRYLTKQQAVDREREKNELRRKKERRVQAKKQRRKERALEEQRALAALKPDPADIVEMYFWKKNRKPRKQKNKPLPKSRKLMFKP